MKVSFISFFICVLSFSSVFSQENPLQKFDFLIGNWEGRGTGFGSSKSVIYSEFTHVLSDNFVNVKNHAEFEPSSQNPKGEIHDDWGIISYDKQRELYIFRQFHNEGYYNQYVLNDSLSTENSLVFETEFIENFVPGGKARFTISIINNSEIETIFDVGFPGQDMACFGRNLLKRK